MSIIPRSNLTRYIILTFIKASLDENIHQFTL